MIPKNTPLDDRTRDPSAPVRVERKQQNMNQRATSNLTSATLNRRQLLRRMGLVSGAAALSSNAYAQLEETPNGSSKHVLIIGGGLAGLCAAYELEQRGHRATILEADPNHIGGRARTLRFDEHNYGELGAMRVPKVHNLTRQYISRFGLSLRPFVQSNPEAFYFARGKRIRIKDEVQLNALYPGLKPNERSMSPGQLWEATVLKRLGKLNSDELADLRSAVLRTDAVKAIDRISFEQLLREEGLSSDAVELLSTAWAYETSLQTSLSVLIREEFEETWIHEFDEIVGGTDRLATAFVERLRQPVISGAYVTRIEQDVQRGKVTAYYQRRAENLKMEADLMICTVPLPVMQRMEFAPGLSGEKMRAVRQVTYDSSTKVIAQTRRRFWETDEGIYGGGTYTDLPTGITYYPSDNASAKDGRVSSGSGTFLASYTWGQTARRLAAVQLSERHRVVFDHLSQVHPQLRENGMIEKVASWSWDAHPYASGAFCWMSPGQHESLYASLIEPEGRIFFAGEHASLTTTWMQGALESALRAVQQLITRYPV